MLNRYYGDDPIISKFLSFLEENTAEVFLYLKDKNVEKTTGIAERHFSMWKRHLCLLILIPSFLDVSFSTSS